MISFKIVNAEALDVMGKLAAGISSPENLKKVHIEIESNADVEEYVREQYKKAWHGFENKPVTSVYKALKKSMLGHTQYGILTSSTYESILSGIDEEGIKAGLYGKWPSNRGKYRVSFSDLLEEELAPLWGFDSVDIFKWRKYNYRRATAYRYGKGAGDVVLSWNSSGLRITWPEEAKRYFKLKDKEFRSEPFETKMYNIGRKDPSKWFYIDKSFQNKVYEHAKTSVKKLIDEILGTGGKAQPIAQPKSPTELGQMISAVLKDTAILAEKYKRGVEPVFDVIIALEKKYPHRLIYRMNEQIKEVIRSIIGK